MKWKLFSLLAVLIFALAACGNTDNTPEDDNAANDNVENTGYNNNTGDGMTNDRDHTMIRDSERDQNRDNDQMNNNGNKQYDVAEEAADRITDEIDEIDNAYVLTTDNNAYVAAELDTNREGGKDQDQGQNKGKNNNDNDLNDQGLNNNTNMNNANGNGDKLTDEVKKKIGDIVKSVNNDIDNVYVSTNPDFLNLTNNYVDDTNNGEPVEGFFDQFGNMVERLFPQNKE